MGSSLFVGSRNRPQTPVNMHRAPTMRTIIVYGRKSEQKNTKTDAARLPPAARPRSLPITTGVVRTSKYWRSRDWLTASKKWKPKDISSVVRMTGTKEGKKPVSAVPRPVASAATAATLCSFMTRSRGMIKNPSSPGTSRSDCTRPLSAAERWALSTAKFV